MTFYAFVGAIEQGLVYALMALGVYLTFRVLDFPDLTVDGSLPLGAAVTATLIVRGWDPAASLVVATAAGAAAGCVTAVLATKLRIASLLAGIITMTALYSINLRIMGRPNLTLLNHPTIFDALKSAPVPAHLQASLAFLITVAVVTTAVVFFLHTRLGMVLRATGDNPQMIRSQGVDTDIAIIVGVGLSNSLVALCGGLVAQSQGFADVGMGIGTIVAGLASVILGESLLGAGSVMRRTLSAVAGSLVYRIAICLALSNRGGFLSLTPSDLNLVTAILVVAFLMVPHFKKRRHRQALPRGTGPQ